MAYNELTSIHPSILNLQNLTTHYNELVSDGLSQEYCSYYNGQQSDGIGCFGGSPYTDKNAISVPEKCTIVGKANYAYTDCVTPTSTTSFDGNCFSQTPPGCSNATVNCKALGLGDGRCEAYKFDLKILETVHLMASLNEDKDCFSTSRCQLRAEYWTSRASSNSSCLVTANPDITSTWSCYFCEPSDTEYLPFIIAVLAVFCVLGVLFVVYAERLDVRTRSTGKIAIQYAQIISSMLSLNLPWPGKCGEDWAWAFL